MSKAKDPQDRRKPKQPPKDMTARLAEQVRKDNRAGKNEPDKHAIDRHK